MNDYREEVERWFNLRDRKNTKIKHRVRDSKKRFTKRVKRGEMVEVEVIESFKDIIHPDKIIRYGVDMSGLYFGNESIIEVKELF